MVVDMMVAEQSGMVVKKVNFGQALHLSYPCWWPWTIFKVTGAGGVLKNWDSYFSFFSFSMQLSWVVKLHYKSYQLSEDWWMSCIQWKQEVIYQEGWMFIIIIITCIYYDLVFVTIFEQYTNRSISDITSVTHVCKIDRNIFSWDNRKQVTVCVNAMQMYVKGTVTDNSL